MTFVCPNFFYVRRWNDIPVAAEPDTEAKRECREARTPAQPDTEAERERREQCEFEQECK
jgi:hypothetical protein